MSNISDLRSTIVPKSDQLNAEQLLNGDMTITVSDVRMGNDEQPVILHYENDQGRPFKPCKTMRKLLIFAWGEDGTRWKGKSMTLYNDPSVRFGGMTVGGIRISHLSHIEREISVSLTATKGKKAQHTILPLEVLTLTDVLKAIETATDRNAMNTAKVLAMKLGEADQKEAIVAYNARLKAIKAAATSSKPTTTTSPYAAQIQRIKECNDLDVLDVMVDEFNEFPDSDDKEALMQAYRDRCEDLSSAA
ncbi:hypothetical protein ACQUFY_21055 [Robbsia andropogonis]|uniref:hypothetical protein n=1 Tax=Robbsia andropogonis TaxID=28092 RepID=UPI003D1CAA7B